MSHKNFHKVGETFYHNVYGKYEIITYNHAKDIVIRFERTGSEVRTSYHYAKNQVKIFDKKQNFDSETGRFLDIVCDTDLKKAAYMHWNHIFYRCYSVKQSKKTPTYSGCDVHDNFKKFSDFYFWYLQQKGCGKKGWQVDKDLLVKGNKVYSQENCCLVPCFINSLLITSKSRRGNLPIGVSSQANGYTVKVSRPQTGEKRHIGFYHNIDDAFIAYKVAKEKYIKDVAHIYKNILDEKVYEALLNYSVDIYD